MPGKAVSQRWNEEEQVVWVWPEGHPSGLQRILILGRSFGLVFLILGIGLALLVLETATDVNSYWRSHPLATNLATEIVMALILALGLQKVMAKRSRRQWRPFGPMIVHELECGGDIDENLEVRVVDHWHRLTGSFDIPDGLPYEEVVASALRDPRTWEGEAEIPCLLDEVREAKRNLKRGLERWAPIMVGEPDLASIIAAVPPLLRQTEGFLAFLETLHPSCVSNDCTAGGLSISRAAAYLVDAFDEYAECRLELSSRIAVYKTGQPIKRLSGKEAEEWLTGTRPAMS